MCNILITTAISYTNGGPHIGHLYESVLADFVTKSFGLFNQVKLLTGTGCAMAMQSPPPIRTVIGFLRFAYYC